MAICMTCGNSYGKTFDVTINNKIYTFDCFECAIHKLAPSCTQCSCKIIGHGVETQGHYYCGAHCAHQAGVKEAKDHI
ncbi:MAG: Uncharacterized protein K0S11_548 [Gammaproteobacteria bacterium]|jgi:hypothetical protein|nr:Uncharacterized protein [Gammaproteobacteria bacterium]